MRVTSPSPLSRIFHVDELLRSQNEFSFRASLEECRDVAEELDLAGLERLCVFFTAVPAHAGGVAISGVVEADVEQLCVVTLKPLGLQIQENFTRIFMPAPVRSGRSSRATRQGRESIDIDFDSTDPPESLHDGRVDLGVVALEELVLCLDPYPRHPEAPPEGSSSAFGQPFVEDLESPFKILEKIKEMK